MEAFFRTLQIHARSVGKGTAQTELSLSLSAQADDDEYGADDDALEAAASVEADAASRLVESPEGRARALLGEMVQIAEQHRAAPDAKMLALLDWMREQQCPAVRIGGAVSKGDDRSWTDRRVLIFTEYGDTKRALFQLLSAAVQGTDDGDNRIMQFHGGMSDEQRDEVQTAFNGPPDKYPVRILIATDAAREGVNLQGHCADLFHFDVPWNPARMEQRNGRIDRTLQPAKEVRCFYFTYPQRPEDRVLKKLVEKVGTIQRELGSLGTVVLERLADAMERGIDDDTATRIDEAEQVGGKVETTRAELETQRNEARLAAEIEEAGRILNRSREVMELDPASLKDAIDVGLELAGAAGLEQLDTESKKTPTFAVPELADSWQRTLDHLRPPRRRDEPPWEWRKKPLVPVVFEPPERMTSDRVHLHLQHPFVQRILSRFLSQGYSAHDLSRVTVVRNPRDSLVRVIAFGRLSLFGPGATRLHDQLVSVAAQWIEAGGEAKLKPFADAADRKAIDTLEQFLAASPTLEGIATSVQSKLLVSAPADFAALWPHIKNEADTLAHEAGRKLEARGNAESEALRAILESQRKRIERVLQERTQLVFGFTETEQPQRNQYEQDEKHMRARLAAIEGELEREPEEIRGLYRVLLPRLEPVGLIYLWPETRS